MSLSSGGWYFKHLRFFHKDILCLTIGNSGFSILVFLYGGVISLWDEIVWFSDDSMSRVQLNGKSMVDVAINIRKIQHIKNLSSIKMI